MEEEDAKAACEAELETEVACVQRIPKEFQDQGRSQKIDGLHGAFEKFTEKEERKGDPSSLHRRRRADEQEVGDAEAKEGDPDVSLRKKKTEQK